MAGVGSASIFHSLLPLCTRTASSICNSPAVQHRFLMAKTNPIGDAILDPSLRLKAIAVPVMITWSHSAGSYDTANTATAVPVQLAAHFGPAAGPRGQDADPSSSRERSPPVLE